MPYLGAHESTAGGLHLAFDRIMSVGGESLQIFTRNQRQWHAPPLSQEEVALFRDKWVEAGKMPVAAHASYLINLASGDKNMAAKSIAAFGRELQRCQQLAIPWLVIHPGSHGGAGVETGLTRIAANLDAVFETAGERDSTMVLLETTAGQGTSLGSSFEELAMIRAQSHYADRLGICFDTCHVFAAGYDIRSPKAYEKTINAFDRSIGCSHLHFFHLNDSKKPLASRVDRHEHIGKGSIGLEGFRCLVNDERFQSHPMTLETPKGKDCAEDRHNLQVLRSLIA